MASPSHPQVGSVPEPVRHLRGVLVATVTAGLLLPVSPPAPAAAGPEQPGFSDTAVLTGLTQPTAVEFSPDGRVFVAQKNGIIRVFSSVTATTSTVFADLRTRVHDFWDRGLLGLALHPNFPTDGRVYVLYTHDALIGGVAPRWGDTCPTPPGATGDGCVVSGRLSVLVASGSTAGPETVLIEDWCQQYPSHSIGDLRFGPDGALYASGGEGASFTFADYGQGGGSANSPTVRNPCGDPPVPAGGTPTVPTAEGGALRSQDLRTSGDATTLDGSILRLNPDTGAAMAGNPLAGSSDPNAARVVAHGLRNPFRFTIRPGTNEVWAGDVGWSSWEEINRIVPSTSAVRNFGWPCYEGSTNRPGTYRDTNICVGLYAAGATAVQTPYFQYAHGQQVANETCSTGSGSSITGLAFYSAGTYPAQYNGALFFADYSRRCIWVMFPGSNGLPDPATRTTFISSAAAPVQLKIGPGGDLFYADFSGGTIHRVRYVTANQPPVAAIQATPTSGPAPLTVTFDGRSSSDPESGALAYSWDLNGDGVFGDATTSVATQQYQAGIYTVRLRVTDPAGATGLASVQIEAGSTGAVRYLSDLPFTSETNGWGPVERDRSNGEPGATDGRPITLNGVVYAKGIGAHAASDVRLLVPADCTRLLVAIGVDDEVLAQGSVGFEVYTNSTLRFSSPVMTGASATQLVDLSVTPGQTLRLVATNGGDNVNYDHADWADARFVCGAGNTPPTARIDLPGPDTTWTATDVIFFTGRGLDNEEGQLPSGSMVWDVVLHHCITPGECHEHPLKSVAGAASGTFEAQDHEYPALLEIRLRVTDGGGLSDTASVILEPQTSDLTFATEPTGLELTVGSEAAQVAPFTHRMIVGGQTSVSAPLVQVRNGISYEFIGWADAPDANRQIVAGASPATYTARYEAAGQVSTTYLSDLPFTLQTNGWGPVERDRSNGDIGAADGRPITVNGVVYAKGIGAHAASDVRLVVPADCTRLLATVGLDDEVEGQGTVRFEVYTGATLRLTSPVMTGQATQLVDVSVTPGQTLRLVVTNGGDNIDYDHGDWADARFLCGATQPPPNQAPSLTQPANQTHAEGAAVNLALVATDPDGDTLAYSASGLPPGLSINPGTGLISGTIAAGAAAGSPYTVVAGVNDGRGGSASRTFSWTVTALPPPNQAPSLTQPANQTHAEGAAVNLALVATDPDGDTLAYSASGLPPGLSINPGTGLISGTIAAGAAAGSPYTVVAGVNDGRGGSASRTFSWTVTPPQPPPAPTGLVATPTTLDTRLAWNAVPAATGYDVYRAAASEGPYLKLNGTPLTSPSYQDGSAPRGTSWYRVIALVGVTASPPASVSAVRPIDLIGTSSAAIRTSSTLQLDVPAGRQVGDLLMVVITSAGAPTITPPAGWTTVRTDTSGQSLRQAVFVRMAATGDPTSYTWTMSQSVATVGALAVYRGVNPTTPIDVHTGRVNPASTSIPITAASSTSPHAVAVVVYAAAWNATITVPQILIDQVGAGAQRGNSRVSVRIGDRVMPQPGTTGTITGTSSKSAVNIGQLIVLRPIP